MIPGSRKSKLLQSGYVVCVLIFLFAPLALSAIYSFSYQRFPAFPVTEFSLRWYERAFSDGALHAALLRSVIVSSIVAAIAVVIGFFGAYTDYRYRFFGKRFYIVLGLLPPTIPLVILGLGMLTSLSRLNLNGTLTGIVISHVVFCTPFALALIRLRLAQMDRCLEPASWNLGVGQFVTLWRVVLRFCAPAILAAALVVFAVSFDEFTIAWFVSGVEQTLPIRVLNLVEREASPIVNVIGTISAATTITLIGIAIFIVSRGRS